jgi:2-C-methyl-D-erythritol 4-phosphate cytidylyltransferase
LATFALIPAAGSGSRIAAGAAKQYSLLAGKPMLWHAVRAVCVPPVTAVFVVLAPDDAQFARQDWSAFGDRLQPLYCGGQTRRDSVYNGLIAMASSVEPDDWVLVHDAARPCLPSADLQKLLAQGAPDSVGAILALPAADTVKIAATDDSGVPRIAGTQDRSYVWLAQTPQMFRCGLLVRALAQAPGATDEASAIEVLGLRPRLVAGSRENIKVTYPEDIPVAEGILGRRA